MDASERESDVKYIVASQAASPSDRPTDVKVKNAPDSDRHDTFASQERTSNFPSRDGEGEPHCKAVLRLREFASMARGGIGQPRNSPLVVLCTQTED